MKLFPCNLIGSMAILLSCSVAFSEAGDERFQTLAGNDGPAVGPRKVQVEWMQNFGGSRPDEGRSVCLAHGGGYVIAGHTASYGIAGWWDVWLIKTDADGNEEWNRTFGGYFEDQAYSVRPTGDGGYIVAGFTSNFGVPGQGWNAWLIKTDADGVEEWNHPYGGTGSDQAYDIWPTDDGGYVFTGTSNSYGTPGRAIWLVKVTGSGKLQWQQTYGGDVLNCWDVGRGVQQTTDGGYIIVGWVTCDTRGFDDLDIRLIKTDAQGGEEWSRNFGAAGCDFGYAVQQTADGGYVVTGLTFSSGDEDGDVWLIKVDAAGNIEWDRTLGGDDWDAGCSVQQTADGGYVVAGATTSSYGEYLHDLLLIRTDAQGNPQWSLQLDGFYHDTGCCVRQTDDQAYVVAGWTHAQALGQQVWLVKVSGDNHPPLIPDQVEGPAIVYAGHEFSFTTGTTDPESHQLFYLWDWGDPFSEDWQGPYASGARVTEEHTWAEPGEYLIRVNAKDDPNGDGDPSDGLESGWSEPLPVTVRLPGDADGSGVVDVSDLLIVLSSWGECPGSGEPCPADFDGSGTVDVDDLLILLSAWQAQ